MLKRLLTRAIPRSLWAISYPLYRKIRNIDERYGGDEYGERADAFEEIFANNKWGNAESKSGGGSTLAFTAPLRSELEQLLVKLKVRTFLDAPCGDFNWMSKVNFPAEMKYLGRDIVPALIEDTRARHAAPQRDFGVLDIVTDDLPKADLWLCRDVLFHLSNDEIIAVLRNFVRSEIPWLLTTTFDFVNENRDVRAGGFRFLNLGAAPFFLPPPARKIADYIVPEPPRYLGLWSREAVAQALAKRLS